MISSGRDTRTVPINTSNFISDGATRIPIDFIPKDNCRFKIEVSPAGTFGKKWSDYAEGFSSAGAIFLYDESGGKKVHRDDSIVPGRQYYIVAPQFSCLYNEVKVEVIGTLKLRHSSYQVYSMITDVSLKNEQRFTMISDYFRSRFGVGLLETAPEIIPLWPPVVEQDVLVPIKNDPIYCAVKSGIDTPTVYSYFGNQVYTVPIHSDGNGENHILIKAGASDTVLSVDRKYIGREVAFRLKKITPSTHKYEYSFSSPNGGLIELESMTGKSFAQGGNISSNSKIELCLGSVDHTYLHIPIHMDTLALPTFQNLKEILIFVDNGILFAHPIQLPQQAELDNVKLLEDFQNHCYGIYVPVPRWVFHLVTILKREGQIVFVSTIKNYLIDGRIPLGALKVLETMYRVRNV